MDADLSHRIADIPERFVPDEMQGELVEAEHLARYWWVSGLADGRRVLDAGCGTGYGTNVLAGAGAAAVTGVDIAESVVTIAQAEAGAGVSFEVADLRRLPFEDGAFDLVVCFEVIEHIDGQPAVLAELARVLAPDGVLVVSSPNPDVYTPGNPHHVHELRPDELRAAVAAELEHVEIFSQLNWVSSVIAAADVLPAGLTAIDGLQGAAVTGARLADAPYSIAVAGRVAPPIPAPRLVGTGLAEPRRWLELYATQQEQLSRQSRFLDEIEDRNAELGAVHEELRKSEAQIARLTGVELRLQQAEASLDAVRAERFDAVRAVRAERVAELEELTERSNRVLAQMRASPSWRLTAPLRALKRLLG